MSVSHSQRVVILYEDRRGPIEGFGLHQLVLAATRDVLHEQGRLIEHHVLVKRIIAIPKNSDSKVLRAIHDDADQLHRGRSAIVAWLDDDKIHLALGVDKRASHAAKLAAICARAPQSVQKTPGAINAFLVRGNLERFLERIDALRPGAWTRSMFDAALRKDLSARDSCFKDLARASHRDWRDAVRRSDGGFDCLIRCLACLAAYEPWPPWKTSANAD